MGKRLKPMGVAGILDNTFFILRDKFWQFQGVIFLSYLPAVIFGILAAVLLLPVVLGGIELLDTDSVEQMDQLFSGLLSSFGLYFFIVGGGFIVALILGSIYMAYGSIRLFSKGLHAEECRVREAFKGIKGKRLRFTGVIIFFILLATALDYLIIERVLNHIPAIDFFWAQIAGSILQVTIIFLFFLSPAVVSLENKGLFSSLRRAFTLAAGHRWRLAGTYILFYLLGYIILLIVYFLVMVPVGFLFFMGIRLEMPVFIIFGLLLCLASVLLFNIFFVYHNGPLTCLYYDLLIRKEGYDLTRRLAVRAPAGVTAGTAGGEQH